MSNVLSNLANLHIFTATVAADGATMTSNGGSASVAAHASLAGYFTITWVQPWLSTPVVGLTALDATYSGADDGVYNASITSVSTTALVVQVADSGDDDADGAAVDAICHVVVIGNRDN